MNSVLGIDLGTQSLKVLFYDYDSRKVIATAAAPLEVQRDANGKAEQRAEAWLDALRHALKEIPETVRYSTRAVGVSGQQHGFVPVDAEGGVLAPVKLWCDTSTQAEAEEITDAAGGRESCIRHSGNPVLSGYTASKILWLKKHHPGRYQRMAHIMLPHDYLNFVLTGQVVMEAGDASGTGLLDVQNRRWSPEMLAAVDSERDLADCLPALTDPQEAIGMITAEAAERFGLPAGSPVSPGGGDNMMAAIGTGNVTPGCLTISLGTSGTLYAYADQAVIDPAGQIAAFCSSTGGWLPLLCTMNCTLATGQMQKVLDVGHERRDQLADVVPPGADGLTMLPYFTGERTPDLPGASASLLGMNTRNCTPGHLLRATMEGATFSIRLGLDALNALGVEAQVLNLTGGGANSRLWRQVVADVFQLQVTVCRQQEGACFGAALQALWMLESMAGASPAIESIVRHHVSVDPELSVDPRPEHAEPYAQAYAAYQRVLGQLCPLFESRGAK